MDKVFCISEDGKKYLGQEFPKFKHKIIVSRLGTRDHGLSEKPYDDFQIISCSSVSEVKRIDLIILGLEMFAAEYKWLFLRLYELTHDHLHSQ